MSHLVVSVESREEDSVYSIYIYIEKDGMNRKGKDDGTRAPRKFNKNFIFYAVREKDCSAVHTTKSR